MNEPKNTFTDKIYKTIILFQQSISLIWENLLAHSHFLYPYSSYINLTLNQKLKKEEIYNDMIIELIIN